MHQATSGLAANPAEPRLENNLPIVEIALQSIVLPLKHPLPLLRLGGLPLIMTVGIEIVGNMLRANGLLHSMGVFWVLLTFTVVYIPFDVGWIRLTLQGTSAIIRRSPISFGRAEREYLIAIVLFGCAWLILLIPVATVALGIRSLDHDLQLAGVLLILWLFVAILVCEIRLLFVFPAIAIGSYQGLSVAWKATRGNFETLTVLYTIVRLPYFLIIAALDLTLEPYSSFTFKALIIGAQCLIFLFEEASVVGMIALSYRRLVAATH